ncbi:MAG: MoxR family ATPase [Lachnospiraceae bacterium]|nr:MoxR family ATPase [Lachnospiraceae bacterium]
MISETNVARVIEEVKKAVVGKDEVICRMMAAILMQGHILIDDIPGVGKTTMALAFARAMDLQQKRMQFTPDVLPSDVTGYFMYDHKDGTFEYKKGPIMSELFLADEINRTSPKTQSALLEVMEERKVTIDGHTLQVPRPFIVIATQNPSGSAGTQPLPDSQIDRFMLCLHMGYPGNQEEIEIIKKRTIHNPLNDVKCVMGKQELLAIQDSIQDIYIHDSIYAYIVELAVRTRKHDMVKLGVSPRGTLALSRMAQGMAFLAGRDYVLPEDVFSVFKDVAAHRIFLNARARVNQLTKDDVLNEILHSVKQPVPWNERKKK